MDNKQQLEVLEEKVAKLKYGITQLEYDLQDKADEIKSAESKLNEPYSVTGSLVWILLCLTITIGICFLLLKWWISTAYSTLTGILFFTFVVVSLFLDIAAISSSTRGFHNKMMAERKEKFNNLLKQKEEMIAEKTSLKKEIKITKDAITNIKELQIKEEIEKKRKIEEEERNRMAILESRFREIINREKIDRDELKAIADAGYVDARIEIAKLLIDDYFSNVYTVSEKIEIMNNAREYLNVSEYKDIEHEFLFLLCDAAVHRNIKWSLQNKLNRIRNIKGTGALEPKYDEIANKAISKIVAQIDELDRKENSMGYNIFEPLELTPEDCPELMRVVRNQVYGSGTSNSDQTDAEAWHAVTSGMMGGGGIDTSGM